MLTFDYMVETNTRSFRFCLIADASLKVYRRETAYTRGSYTCIPWRSSTSPLLSFYSTVMWSIPGTFAFANYLSDLCNPDVTDTFGKKMM